MPQIHRRRPLAETPEPGGEHARVVGGGVRSRRFAIDRPTSDYSSVADVFERALQQEQEVSRQIDSLYEIAFNEKAFSAVAELQWFLTEQVEEEKTAREIVAKFKLVGNDPSSLLDLDRELGARSAIEGTGRSAAL